MFIFISKKLLLKTGMSFIASCLAVKLLIFLYCGGGKKRRPQGLK